MQRTSSTSSSDARRLAARLLRFAPVAVCVIATNCFLDGGSGRPRGALERELADDLLLGRPVLWQGNEMEFQRQFFDRVAHPLDVVVVGSSRCLPVETRHAGGPTLWNACVTTAQVEDIAVLYWLSTRSRLAPRAVLLSIDVMHFLPRRSEPRYNRLARARELQRVQSETSVPLVEAGTWPMLRISELLAVLSPAESQLALLRAADHLLRPSRERGAGRGRTFPRRGDGSVVFPPRPAGTALERPDAIRGWGEDTVASASARRYALAVLDGLLRNIKADGRRPILLLPPYHPALLELPATRRELRRTETALRHRADELGIPVIGSFDAVASGCRPEEFRDWTHPTTACFDRLFEKGLPK